MHTLKPKKIKQVPGDDPAVEEQLHTRSSVPNDENESDEEVGPDTDESEQEDTDESGQEDSESESESDSDTNTSTGSVDLNKYNMTKLKDMLRERGLRVGGTKSTLIHRLQHQQ